MGFPDPCIALPPEASDEEIERLCQEHTARLYRWIEKAKAEGPVYVTRYDGTMGAACRIYQEHPDSPFHDVKANTRRTYTDSLKLIERTVGKRLVRNVSIHTCKSWYKKWREPLEPGGPERIDRAHNAISMVKTAIYFCSTLKPEHRFKDCKSLAFDLEKTKFEKGGARSEEMTFAYARDFIRKAIELGQRGVVPLDRARCMAIGVAAQFELGLRQKDIIGERPKTQADLDKAIRHGATAINYGGQMWTGFFTWENIPGWIWRMRTSKSKYRAAAMFELQNYSLLYPLLEAVPHDQRVGAIVKGEHGFAVQERSYRKWFRAIARAANIPDTVWNMDTRAGAATEAEEAGVEREFIKDLLTHSRRQEETTVRYIRQRSKRLAAIQEARERHRASGGDEGGTT